MRFDLLNVIVCFLLVSFASAADLKTSDSWEAEFQKRLDWWSLKPMRQGEPPTVDDAAWSKEPVDRFIKAALDSAKLAPAPPADAAALHRRLSFALTGLPPAAHESHSPHPTYESYLDSLLASPHFGEHFARHWMDVVRYTDTYGYEWDNPAKGSHEYRDYLIRAFNDDIGFDQLVREQLAGDLLQKPRLHKAAQTNESLIGPMFYHMGEHRHGSSLMFNGIHQEMVNNKIDAFSKAFLATTVACARCHDHKLEAVSQRDYYSLAAMFTTPRWTSRVVDAPGKNDAAIAKLKELRASIRAELAKLWSHSLRSLPLCPSAAKEAQDGSVSPQRGKGAEGAKWESILGDVSKLKPKPNEIAYPLVRLLQRSNDVTAAFNELKTEWIAARTSAKKANASFKPLLDLDHARLPEGWVFEGNGFAHGFVAEATPLIALEGENIVSRLLPRGWHSHALSSKLPASLRMPPQHLVPGKFVSLNVAGGEFGGHLVVDDHAFQNETIAFYTNTDPQWKSFADAGLKNGAQQVTIEFCTSSLNPNFPPRTGLAKGLKNNDFGYDKRSWISITGIVTHDTSGTPQDEFVAFTGLYQNNTATDPWQRIATWLNAAVQRWCAQRPQSGDTDVLNWLLANGLLPNKVTTGTKLAQLIADYRRVEAGIAFPRTCNSMDEREVAAAKYPLNLRGNVDAIGDLLQPGSLQMLHGEGIANRLALADSLIDPEHPLTARVYVNRVWQWIFGTGLVATPDDFGRLGDKPSHPELLDWLARDFIRKGWSTKKLVRKLVLSQTFRQGSGVNPRKGAFQAPPAVENRRSLDVDPNNRLLSYYPTRRLEAESIRDALLAVSGRLDPQLYGRPILPYRTAEDPPKRFFSGPLDGDGRRSIYQQMSIMQPPKFLTGFNLPDLKLPTGRRDVTNVPTQALVLLNDPFVLAMAKHWAEELMTFKGSDEELLRHMFQKAYARDPSKVETSRWLKEGRFSTAQAQGGALSKRPEAVEKRLSLESLAHALFNTKEFIYYR